MREKLGQMLARASGRAADTQRNDRLGALAGFATLAVLAGADLALGADVNLIGTLIVVPFVAAVWAGIRVTALVGAVTLIAAIASGTWNMNFGETDYDARVVVLLARSPAGRRERLGARASAPGGTAAAAAGRGRRDRRWLAAAGPDAGAGHRGDRPRVRRLLHGRRDARAPRDAVRRAGPREADGRGGPPDGAQAVRARPQPARVDDPPRGAVPAPAPVHPPLQRRGHPAHLPRRRRPRVAAGPGPELVDHRRDARARPDAWAR